MRENPEMIYTAIYQNAQGRLTYGRYLGNMSRKEAWVSAASLGEPDQLCLVALVPGDHPVYFYEDVGPSIKDVDVFDLNV